MKWTTTKTTVTVGIAILAVVAVALVVKHQSVKDSYFDPDTDKLWQLPANLTVVRPTHFPKLSAQIRHVQNGDSGARMLGRNVPLRDVIAEAYDCNPARVLLPADAPTNGFDFLATTADPRKHLQKAVQRKLGYTAHRETRDTEVWVLKVANPNLPGLTVSANGEKTDIVFKNGKLYFTHQPLSVILDGLSRGLDQPVVNQTGLTDDYDFSVQWNGGIQEKMETGAFSLAGVKQVLKGWGLTLEQDTQPMDMFIVEKAR